MKLLKKLSLKAIIWAAFTMALIILDTKLSLSELFDWFPVIGIFLPILCAIFLPIRKQKRIFNKKIGPNPIIDIPITKSEIDARKNGTKKVDRAIAEIESISKDVEQHSREFLEKNCQNLKTFADDRFEQQKDSTFKPIPVEIPKMFTEKEYAQNLIERAKEYARKINNSTNVLDFVVAYNMIKQSLEELAWFNEERHIFMYPSPRSDFDKMYNNMENTINDFIYRSMGRIKKAGGNWTEKLESLFSQMEHDSCFSSLMTDSNREQIQQIREQLKSNVKPYTVPAPISLAHPKTDVKIDYDQIIKDELAWRREQMGQSAVEQELDRIDKMDGHAFERWCASLLEASGFTDVEVTRGSGDQGVDVLATMEGGVRYAVQCKCYSSDLGNKPVQEVYAGIAMYNCQVGCVMTNRHFTVGAKELAKATGISLWDRDWIISLLEELDADAFPL